MKGQIVITTEDGSTTISFDELKGDTGLQGVKGDTGNTGDAFTFDDFTPEQLASLKGTTGDTGATGSKGDKGDKGDTGAKGDTGEGSDEEAGWKLPVDKIQTTTTLPTGVNKGYRIAICTSSVMAIKEYNGSSWDTESLDPYSVIPLKHSGGIQMYLAKVILKVKGKTYKATTNSKGKATFKIKKLNKKGTFKATVTYKGNKYFKKVSKKAKIKVSVTFKTISSGSKDKATVKKIQNALKNKGYYTTYKGHTLAIDGEFSKNTVRSIKQFQKDKGLKVTGRVDEKTAKKLGII